MIDLTLSANHDDIPEMSSKALATLSLDDESVCEKIQTQLIKPVLDRFCRRPMTAAEISLQLNILGLLFRVPQHRLFGIEYDSMILFSSVIL